MFKRCLNSNLKALTVFIFLLAVTINANALECNSDEDCMWCGWDCVRADPNLFCIQIAPPEGYECKCINGICTKVPILTNKTLQEIKSRLENIAYNLALALSDPNTRANLAFYLTSSPYLESKIDLANFTRDLSISYITVYTITNLLTELEGLGVEEIDVYFPVEQHLFEYLNDTSELLVAYDPLNESADVIAFWPNGTKVVLSSDKPPRVPTLVVAPSEGRLMENTSPLLQLLSPTQACECDIGSTYMKYIHIYDTKEPWFRGKPEIYCWIVRENGIKDKKYWLEIAEACKDYYFGCNRPILDRWWKEDFRYVGFAWFEEDWGFKVNITVNFKFGPVKVQINSIIIDSDDEMGTDTADWYAVQENPCDEGKEYDTGIVEFRIAGKYTTQTPGEYKVIRNLPDFVQLGEIFDVTLTIDGISAGAIFETIPDGFTFIGSDADHQIDGNTITFTIFGETGVIYTVQASETEGTYTFTGTWESIMPEASGTVAGDNTIIVTLADSDWDGLTDEEELQLGTDPYKADTDSDEWSDFAEVAAGTNPNNSSDCPQTDQPVMRELPSSVQPNDIFDVTLTIEGITAGAVTEVIPAGFVFLSSDASYQLDGNAVTFALFGEESINYTLKAPSDQSLIDSTLFGGKWTDIMTEQSGAVGGDQSFQKQLTKAQIKQQIINLIFQYMQASEEQKQAIKQQIIQLIFQYMSAPE